jgi:hypothetical protein
LSRFDVLFDFINVFFILTLLTHFFGWFTFHGWHLKEKYKIYISYRFVKALGLRLISYNEVVTFAITTIVSTIFFITGLENKFLSLNFILDICGFGHL